MKKWLVTLFVLAISLAVGGIVTGFTLTGGDEKVATSIDDIDPNVCNAVHNIDACTQEELYELGLVGDWG